MSAQTDDRGVQRLGGARCPAPRGDMKGSQRFRVTAEPHERGPARGRRNRDIPDATEVHRGLCGDRRAHRFNGTVAQACGDLGRKLDHSGTRPDRDGIGQGGAQTQRNHILGHRGAEVDIAASVGASYAPVKSWMALVMLPSVPVRRMEVS
jgi:hypothetical protein